MLRFCKFAFLAALLNTASAYADEGMWLYNSLPTKQLHDKYNFDPSDQWISHVMRSSVRFNSGGSGSFVSANGLVLTNHHVAADTIAKVSTPEHNFHHDGFYAKTQAEEIKAPDLELNQLISIENVTDKVNAAVAPGSTDEQAAKARRAVIAQIEKESLTATGLRSDVVTLYQGGQYHLYRYKKYTDVRVVFVPEFDIAFFGGDPDNFEYPRYDLDMAIFRVYENGKPAKIDDYLQWGGHKGADENELVFVSGNPGRTSRMFTVSALEFKRDVELPLRLNQLRRMELALQLYAQRGPEQARHSQGNLFGVQNTRKSQLAALQGLQNPELIAAKQTKEYALRARASSDPALQQYANAWTRIEQTMEPNRKMILKHSLLEKATGFNSKLFTIARQLVRLGDESAKPNAERLPEFQDAGRASLEQQLYSDAPLYPEFEEYMLADSLAYLQEELGPSHSIVKTVLAGHSPAERAHELITKTSLTNVSVRKLLATGGRRAIDSSYDPMVQLARSVDAAARAVRKQLEDTVQEPQKQSYAQIAKVDFAVNGTSVYPDATFTLRLAFGTVTGYKQAGNTIPAWTTMSGAFAHEKKHNGKEPYLLPKTWHDDQDKIDGTTPFNFVSTADIIGGNSGSPVIDRDGKLVGLIFDGNIQSLTADFAYTDVQSRAVSVDVRAMTEALEKIYKVDGLVKELTAAP